MSLSTSRPPQELLEESKNWQTRLGTVFVGDRVILWGKDILTELADERWMSVYLYGLTGRRFTPNQVAMADTLWTLCACYPDPRVWNNRIAAMAGSARGLATLSVAAGNAATDAELYGLNATYKAAKLLREAAEAPCLRDFVHAELSKKRNFYGFGRPMATVDERKKPLLAAAKRNGVDGGFLRIALEIEEILTEKNPSLLLNSGGMVAAVLSNLGLSPEEAHRHLVPSFTGGMVFCHADAERHPVGTLFPLSCSDVAYCGNEPRAWPSQKSKGELCSDE